MKNNKCINKDIAEIELNDGFFITKSERTELSISWFSLAQDNFDTSQILLEHRKYHHSVFFMQQTIECIIKAILLENNIIKDTKNFSHSPEKAFLQLYEAQDAVEELKICKWAETEITKCLNFEKRMEYSASIVNALTRMKDNSNFQIYTDIIYVNRVIFCLALLFSSTNQNSRYIELSNNEINTPKDIYNTESIINGLNTVSGLFKYILHEIIGDECDNH